MKNICKDCYEKKCSIPVQLKVAEGKMSLEEKESGECTMCQQDKTLYDLT